MKTILAVLSINSLMALELFASDVQAVVGCKPQGNEFEVSECVCVRESSNGSFEHREVLSPSSLKFSSEQSCLEALTIDCEQQCRKLSW